MNHCIILYRTLYNNNTSNIYIEGVITMKKLTFLLISLLMFLFVACESQDSINKSNSLSVSIITDIDTYSLCMSSVRGITLTPQLEGVTDKEIQYHWSINSDTESFYLPSGTQKEVINSGESVLFVPIADIGYSEPDKLSNTIKINLRIEEKQSSNILAETELIIEDYSGTYKVKK